MILTADILFPVAGAPIPHGAVRVRGGRIVEAGPLGSLTAGRPGEPIRRFEGAAILPGLVNLHSHLEFTALGPLAEPRPFLDWLADLVTRSRAMAEADWLASARAGARLALEAGMTALADITRTGAGLEAMSRTGLKGVSALEWVAVGEAQVDGEWERFERRYNGLAAAGAPEGLTLGISPHSPYTLSRRALERAGAFARERRLPVMSHVAETHGEVALVQGRGGPMAPLFPSLFGLDFSARPEKTPLAYLERVGLLTDSTLLAHGVHLSDDDLARIGAAGAALALCPTSNAMLGAGTPPDPARLDRLGVRWGVGTDSLASVPALDLLGEARSILGLWPSTDPDRLLRAVTLDAARILRMERTGALSPGWAADIAVVSIPAGVRDARGLIEGAGRAVQVFVDGQEKLPLPQASPSEIE